MHYYQSNGIEQVKEAELVLENMQFLLLTITIAVLQL